MTVGQFIDNFFLGIGSIVVAATVLYAMWFFIVYVFLGGDDMERTRAKHRLLYATLTLVFTMVIWGLFSMIGGALGL